MMKTERAGKPTRIAALALLAAAMAGGCSGRNNIAQIPGDSAEPDKLLYNRAASDVQRGRYIVGRLTLQTLINTYPDSEYLAKAKLMMGDSYYREGGISGLKQAIAEYKDFITFFPFLDEAPYAQMQVGMAHYRQMEKPDRDHAEALSAEAELQTFLEKYPESPLVPEAQQHLREVQEVLAEGNFRIAQFYYIRQGYRAAGARLIELTKRYPLYSQADQANWMLAQIYEKTERNDFAAQFYSRIVKDYPLSPRAESAKEKLEQFGVPVPQPDPTALARMQQEGAFERPGLLGKSLGIFKTRPDVSTAAHSGEPTMAPASESGDETLSFGPASATLGAGGVGAPGNSATVETVTPGAGASREAPAATASGPTTEPSEAPDAAATGSSTPAKAQPLDKNQESTSKKKKGVRKIIPW